MNLIVKSFKKVLHQRMKMHFNDPKISEKWDEMVHLIGGCFTDVETAFDSLNEEEMEYASEIFEDLSTRLQSKQLLSYFKKLQIKYPHINMQSDLDYAKKALEQHH